MIIQLTQVREFQEAFKQTLNNSPRLLSVDDASLRYTLQEEELGEYEAAAVYDNNLLEVLDSLVDQMYVLLGTVNAHGMQDVFLEAFDRVHKNNMSKLHNGKVVKNEFGKVIKPKDFVPVDLSDLIK